MVRRRIFVSWVGLLALGGATTCPAAGREVALVASSDGGSATEGARSPRGWVLPGC